MALSKECTYIYLGARGKPAIFVVPCVGMSCDKVAVCAASCSSERKRRKKGRKCWSTRERERGERERAGKSKKKRKRKKKSRGSRYNVLGGSRINISQFHFCWLSIWLGTVHWRGWLCSFPFTSLRKRERETRGEAGNAEKEMKENTLSGVSLLLFTLAASPSICPTLSAISRTY